MSVSREEEEGGLSRVCQFMHTWPDNTHIASWASRCIGELSIGARASDFYETALNLTKWNFLNSKTILSSISHLFVPFCFFKIQNNNRKIAERSSCYSVRNDKRIDIESTSNQNSIVIPHWIFCDELIE